MTMLRAGGLLDVLTPLSDCRQESVEKMERRIPGFSYMYWMDFYNESFCCGFLCARLISVYFSGPLFRLPRRGLPRRGLPRPHRCIQANRLPRLQGYHTRATTLQTNFWVMTGRRMNCRVTTVDGLPSSTGFNSS